MSTETTTCPTCTRLARHLAAVRGDLTHLSRRLSRFRPDQLTFAQRTMLDNRKDAVSQARAEFLAHQDRHQ